MTIKKAIKLLDIYLKFKHVHLVSSLEYEKKAYVKDTFEIPKIMREQLVDEIQILERLQTLLVGKGKSKSK